jgi:hypothetical protein
MCDFARHRWHRVRADWRFGARAWAMVCIVAAGLASGCTPAPDPASRKYPEERRPDVLPPEYADISSICSPAAAPASGAPEPEPGSVAVPLGRSADEPWWDRFEVGMRCVIRSQSELEEVWGFARSPTSLPQIDFAEEIFLLVSAGERPTGGHFLGVVNAWRRGDTTFVWVREWGHGHGCDATQAVTWPADGVRIPAVPVIHFVETWGVDTC